MLSCASVPQPGKRSCGSTEPIAVFEGRSAHHLLTDDTNIEEIRNETKWLRSPVPIAITSSDVQKSHQ